MKFLNVIIFSLMFSANFVVKTCNFETLKKTGSCQLPGERIHEHQQRVKNQEEKKQLVVMLTNILTADSVDGLINFLKARPNFDWEQKAFFGSDYSPLMFVLYASSKSFKINCISYLIKNSTKLTNFNLSTAYDYYRSLIEKEQITNSTFLSLANVFKASGITLVDNQLGNINTETQEQIINNMKAKINSLYIQVQDLQKLAASLK